MPRPEDWEPIASPLSDHISRTHVSAFSVTCAQVALDSFARAAVLGPTAGGYCIGTQVVAKDISITSTYSGSYDDKGYEGRLA